MIRRTILPRCSIRLDTNRELLQKNGNFTRMAWTLPVMSCTCRSCYRVSIPFFPTLPTIDSSDPEVDSSLQCANLILFDPFPISFIILYILYISSKLLRLKSGEILSDVVNYAFALLMVFRKMTLKLWNLLC